jgi:hypothetical protein
VTLPEQWIVFFEKARRVRAFSLLAKERKQPACSVSEQAGRALSGFDTGEDSRLCCLTDFAPLAMN